MPYSDPCARRTKGLEATRRFRARKTQVKIASFEAVIASRPKWPDVDLAWAAGMFEGEGTITIASYERDGRRYGRSWVCLTSTDDEIVDFFQQRWPGMVRIGKTAAHHKTHQTWRITNNKVIGFLEDILPFLRTTSRREKAELLIESQRARWAGYQRKGHAEKMECVRLRLRLLNQRGVAAQLEAPL